MSVGASLPADQHRPTNHSDTTDGDDRLRTLDRYILREVALTWLAVTSVLLVILMSNRLARVLAQAAANDFPRDVVFALIALTSAGYLTVIVPIGFFLAIVLGLGRLYHESEMAALQACGVGPAGLFRPIAVLGAAIVALLVWLSFFAIPAASARAQAIRIEALREAQFGALEPGRFRTFGGGSVVFYAERVDDNGILYNVNVFVDRPDERAQAAAASAPSTTPADTGAASKATSKVDTGNKLEIWVASRAEQRGAGQAEQTFVLYDGYRYEGAPGGGQFRIIRFSEGGIPIQLGTVAGGTLNAATKTTAQLLSSSMRDDLAELHWRIAMPVSALLLMLIAVPLSRLRPRQGRFGKIGIAILVYFLYSRLMVSGRTWIETDAVPTWVGLWWTHGIALVGGLWLLLRENPPGRAKQLAVSVPMEQ